MIDHPSLQLDHVVRDYGNGAKVGPVAFSAQRGEFISLLGPSGCGKTTLLRCIAGFEPVNQGRILVGGVDISREAPHKRGVGLIFQNFALFPHLTVAMNVAFGLRLRRLPVSEIEAKVAEALALVGLDRMGERYPAQLSGGQQQRVAIARSLVLRPEIMLLDEPLSSLDQKLRLQMRYELRSMQQQLQMTFVYVTHDQGEALSMSDKIVVLSQGQIEQTGTPAEIYARPATRFIADFIGSSNLLKVEQLDRTGEELWRARLEGGGEVLVRGEAPPRAGSPIWLSIRPEHFHIIGEDETSAAENRLNGIALGNSYSGDRTEVTVAIDGSEHGPATKVSAYSFAPKEGRVALTFASTAATFVRH